MSEAMSFEERLSRVIIQLGQQRDEYLYNRTLTMLANNQLQLRYEKTLRAKDEQIAALVAILESFMLEPGPEWEQSELVATDGLIAIYIDVDKFARARAAIKEATNG